jgi:hypothetical protein
MGKAAYQQLLDRLAALPVTEEARRKFEQLIRLQAALDGVTSLERQERVDFARHLRHLGEPRTVIRDRLMAKYALGRSQAYQVIDQSLQLSGF